MDSRIILSTADFSANNIGRIVELSDLTKKVLTKQTQYTEDSEEAVALDTFLTNLTSGGFIGGNSPLLTSLFIPALANSHDELLYNIASLDGNGYPVNGMSDGEISASQKAYAPYKKNGKTIAICRHAVQGDEAISDESTQLDIDSKLFTETGAYKSFSLAMYCLSTTSTSSGTTKVIRNGSSTGAKFRITYQNKIVFTDPSYVDELSAPIEGTLLGFNGISYVKDTRFEGMGDHITIGNTTITDITKVTITDAAKASKLRIGEFKYGDICVIPVLATGEYMDSTKLGQLRTYVNTLLTALHATEL